MREDPKKGRRRQCQCQRHESRVSRSGKRDQEMVMSGDVTAGVGDRTEDDTTDGKGT